MSLLNEFLADEVNEEAEPENCSSEQQINENDEQNSSNSEGGENSCNAKKSSAEKECDELKTKVQELEKQLETLQDLNLRLRAEFENFKKRTAKEKLELYSSGQTDCLLEFLPVFDSVERGLEMFSEEVDSEASKGFKLLLDNFNQVLQKLSIESFGEKGDEFNPAYHNAIKTLEVEGFGNNLIYEVLQKGYCKGENVFRHAMVVVANP